MHHTSRPPARHRSVSRARHIAVRIARHRRAATEHLLHGVCRGIGAGAVTLLVIWAQQYR
ncbi:hypothetical protein [Streptomyces sp. NPDC020965]|uniref:hypothetical protein n=1 Tax=Streptomyces sp. NPDC020965 TaxID=3365105 RepID=UPI00378E3E86